MAKPKKLPLVKIEGQTNATLLSPELINQIEKYYRIGIKDTAVANMVGISPGTLTQWLLKGMANHNGLYSELFRRSAKAVSSSELEYVAKIRDHALGVSPEYAYEETTNVDGSVTKKVQLDKDGNPVILKEGIKSNPVWVSWFLQRRHSRTWLVNEKNELGESPLDEASFNTTHNDNVGNVSKIPVHMTFEERQELLDKVKKKLEDDMIAQEKEVSQPNE